MTAETKSEFARRIGKPKSLVSVMLREGRLVMDAYRPNMVDVERSLAQIEATQGVNPGAVARREKAAAKREERRLAAIRISSDRPRDEAQPVGVAPGHDVLAGAMGQPVASPEGGEDLLRQDVPLPPVVGRLRDRPARQPAQMAAQDIAPPPPVAPAPRDDSDGIPTNPAEIALERAREALRKERAVADQAEDARDQARGHLIPLDLLDAVLSHAFATIRAGLMAQHNAIASQYPEIPPNAIRGIQQSNRELLAGLSQTRLPESVRGSLLALAVEP